ncbi:MAG: glycosyltransferase [Candidatus Binataceae bacterium]|nr:glycosyltransferase [Candidatus Binataceae bacterium]
MRLLHLHSGNLFGGVETMLLTIAREGRRTGRLAHEFALAFDGRLAAELRAAGAPVYHLGEVRARNPMSVRRARRHLAEFLASRPYDAAICHMAWAQALFGAVARRAGIAEIFWMHDAAAGRHWVERWAALSPPDFAICNSRYTAATLGQIFPRTPSQVLYYPVAPAPARLSAAARAAIRAEFKTPPDAIVIIQTSRMEPWKGHRMHLEALARLADLPGWVCWQAGGGQRPREREYLTSLERMARELGIGDRVRFLGQRTDVARLLGAADVHCQPNAGAEPFGIVFIEALGAGLPVVSVALGGALEIIDESCGILVAPGATAALAEALRRLIIDGAERARLGAAGPARAAQLCDTATQMARLEAAIVGLTGGADQADRAGEARV